MLSPEAIASSRSDPRDKLEANRDRLLPTYAEADRRAHPIAVAEIFQAGLGQRLAIERILVVGPVHRRP